MAPCGISSGHAAVFTAHHRSLASLPRRRSTYGQSSECRQTSYSSHVDSLPDRPMDLLIDFRSDLRDGLGRYRVEGDGILYDGRRGSSAPSLPPSPDISITGRLPFLLSRKSAVGICGSISSSPCCSRLTCGYGQAASPAPRCPSYYRSSVSRCWLCPAGWAAKWCTCMAPPWRHKKRRLH